MSVRYVASSRLPTPWGVFDMHGFEDIELAYRLAKSAEGFRIFYSPVPAGVPVSTMSPGSRVTRSDR